MRKPHLFLFTAVHSLLTLNLASRRNSAGPHREESDMGRVCQRHQRVRRLRQIWWNAFNVPASFGFPTYQIWWKVSSWQLMRYQVFCSRRKVVTWLFISTDSDWRYQFEMWATVSQKNHTIKRISYGCSVLRSSMAVYNFTVRYFKSNISRFCG